MLGTRIIWLISFLIILSGCTSFGRGVAEAILEQDKEDTRACHVEGPASEGVEAFLRAQETERQAGHPARILKVLMVHGIGKHLPGYSGRLTDSLMHELGLDVRDEDYKEVILHDPQITDDPLGRLRISRYTNKARTRELLFYELTWSEITEEEKRIVEFDSTSEYTFRRASVNASLKKFLNSHIPDVLVFYGELRVPILASVRQSFCWMTLSDWDGYADFADMTCDLAAGERTKQLLNDDYVIVTHSLGSRIAVDTLAYFGNLITTADEPYLVALRKTYPDMNLRIYMLANQMPLLEMGRKRAPVLGQIHSYCRPEGEHFEQRILTKLPIYAFSDPNDILSYPIPPQYAANYIDSRLCPKITNITINLIEPTSLFGVGEFAAPGKAHLGYDHDDRVISLIAHGVGHDDAAPIVKQRCTWLETIESGS